MMKVFIAEDEPLIRDSLRKIIAELEAPYDLVYSGEAADGEIALSMIQEIKPDILLTDIRMPFMDGLSLAKYAKEILPWLQVIIISGFEDFEYSRQAIQIGVKGYITKPIQKDELATVLEKIVTESKEVDAQQRKPDHLEELTNFEFYKEHFLNKLKSHSYQPNDIYERSNKLNFNFLGKSFGVLYATLQPKQATKETYHNLLLTLQRTFGEDPGTLLTAFDNFSILGLVSDRTLEGARNKAYAVSDILNYELAQFDNQAYQIFIGGTTNRLSELGTLLSWTEKSAENYPQQETQKLIELPQQALSENADLFDKEAFDQLLTQRVLSYDAIWTFLTKEAQESQPRQNLPLFRQTILNYLLSHIQLANTDSYQRLTEEYGIDELMTITQSPSLFKLTLRLFVEELQNAVKSPPKNQNLTRSEQLIAKSKKIMRKNFDDPNLSLQSMAEELAISPAYLSAIYSQNEGQTFIEALTFLRMEKAKELLKTTNKKIIEITFDIGYNDPNYFSFIFKKRHGLSPKEYRQENH